MRRRRLKRNAVLYHLSAGEVSVGAMLFFGSPDLAEQVARLGVDWVWLDWQHGQWTEESISDVLARFRDLPAVPFVRVKSLEPGQINWVLDMGALGVIVPMVQDAAMAQAVVEATHYPPIGRRSTGGVRLRHLGGDTEGQTYLNRANDEIAVVVMVETESAISNIDSIMQVPHLDAVLVGTGDLLIDVQSRGKSIEYHESLIGRVVEASRRYGVPVGFPCLDAESTRKRIQQGFQLVSCTTDEQVLLDGMKQIVCDVRAR